MGSLSEIHDDLRGEWSALEAQWHSTRSQWRDAVADRFEKEFWQEMEEGIPQFLRELEEVDQTLNQALRSLDR
ncbi:MAG: hypothetical protein JWM21_265 [Acidobacteria bacterium]|nr:hypothetical protein [Acidobacteriota bacterium]